MCRCVEDQNTQAQNAEEHIICDRCSMMQQALNVSARPEISFDVTFSTIQANLLQFGNDRPFFVKIFSHFLNSLSSSSVSLSAATTRNKAQKHKTYRQAYPVLAFNTVTPDWYHSIYLNSRTPLCPKVEIENKHVQ